MIGTTLPKEEKIDKPLRRFTVRERRMNWEFPNTQSWNTAASSQRFPNSWNAMFTLITARDSGVPPYSRSVSSSSVVKTGNFGLSPAAISSAVFCPMPVFAASTSARLNCT